MVHQLGVGNAVKGGSGERSGRAKSDLYAAAAGGAAMNNDVAEPVHPAESVLDVAADLGQCGPWVGGQGKYALLCCDIRGLVELKTLVSVVRLQD